MDSIAVQLRRHCGSGGTRFLDPTQLLFSSALDSVTPNISHLKCSGYSKGSQKKADSDQMGGLGRSWGCLHTGTGRSLALSLLTAVVLVLGRPEQSWFVLLVKRLVTHFWTFRVAVSEKAAEVPLKDPKLRAYGNL